MSVTTPETAASVSAISLWAIRSRSGRIECGSSTPSNSRDRSRVQDVRRADESGDEAGSRVFVDLPGRADMLDAALVEHGDAIAHRQRLALIVGDEHEGDADLVLDRFQLDLHLFAQFQIQGTERFVEEQHLRVVDQCSGQGDALALATAELIRSALAVVGESNNLEHLRCPPSTLGLADLAHLQAVGDVLEARSCAGTAHSPERRC